MKILVLGGGQQGRVIAGDLATSMPHAQVDVADIRKPQLPELANLKWVKADLADPTATARKLHGYDLAVGALPSRFGFGALKAAIDAGCPIVDVSFCAEDPLTLEADARRAAISILPDCGLAPGLTSLCAGRAAARGTPDEIVMYVGGVAQDRERPYGYVVTWSLEDLLEEYVRPARIVRGGKQLTLPAFDELSTIEVEGVGTMESFLSDGLRTLIRTMPDVPEMSERTLRWPGHAAKVKPIVAAGRFLDEFRNKCVETPARDLVAMVTNVRWGTREARATLVDRYDEATGLTAMSRTTALTTSAVAQWVAGGGAYEPGVTPLETVGRDQRAYNFITKALAGKGVNIAWSETG